jgi:membrane-associated phospholipid phosphatase
MSAYLDWGIAAVLWLQQFSPGLDFPFTLFSFLGSQTWFMLLLPVFYWCGDRPTGRDLLLLFLLSALINSAAKDLLGQPRPFDYDPLVRKLEAAAGGGLPSGHTQNAVVVYGFLAWRFGKPWLWAAAALLTAGVALSRVYLGAHFPTDLAGGAILGALSLAAYARWAAPAAAWFGRLDSRRQLTAALALPLLLIVIGSGSGGPGPAAAAALAGMGAGFVLEPRLVGFESGGAAGRRMGRFLIGSIGLFALDKVLKLAFTGFEPQLVFSVLRYGLLGAWVALGAPGLFVRLRLAARDRPLSSASFDPGRRLRSSQSSD